MAAYRRDLMLVRNALDTTAFGFAPREHPRPRLIWIRAFHEMYNPVLAVEVLARVGRSHPGATLTMVGPDKDGSRTEVERRADKLGVRDRLILVGQVPRSEIARHLADADVFLNTTNIDNTPLSILEAMAAGLCVVSTSVGGIPFLLNHDRNALLVPSRDAVAMTSAIERLLDEVGLASRLSRAGNELARECDWSSVLTQWEHTLEGIGARSG